jgi:putative transcriptional regulator
MNRKRRHVPTTAEPNHRLPSFGGKVIAALEDFTDALEKGEVHKRFTVRTFKVPMSPAKYGPDLVRSTRKLLHVSQALFARFLGVSARTVHAWEQGANTPSQIACRFMDEIRRAPDYWRKRLQEELQPAQVDTRKAAGGI